jgi:hypothetical protein
MTASDSTAAGGANVGSNVQSNASESGGGAAKEPYKVAYNLRGSGPNQLFSAIPQGVNTVTFEMQPNDNVPRGQE